MYARQINIKYFPWIKQLGCSCSLFVPLLFCVQLQSDFLCLNFGTKLPNFMSEWLSITSYAACHRTHLNWAGHWCVSVQRTLNLCIYNLGWERLVQSIVALTFNHETSEFTMKHFIVTLSLKLYKCEDAVHILKRINKKADQYFSFYAFFTSTQHEAAEHTHFNSLLKIK